MTRINLIPVTKLTDQHLLAEYRELPRIFGIIKKKIKNGKKIIPGENYTLGKGHIIFFYDKLGYLEERYKEIINECKKRGFKIKYSYYDISDIPNELKNNYKPTKKDIKISLNRIKEKIKEKKGFYKKYGKYIYFL